MVAALAIFGITIIGIILCVIIFPTIKLGKISVPTYPLVALLGAIASLCFGLIDFGKLGNEFIADTAVNPLKILVLFFSMTYISVFLDGTGFFAFLASKAMKRAKGSQWKLFFVLFALISILTVFTSNDIVILTFTPFICLFARHAKIKPIPYIVMEFAAANTWSMMLMIGNPTNIFLSGAASIGFVDYLRVMALPTLVAGVAEIAILSLLFRKDLSVKIEETEVEEAPIRKTDMIIGLVHLLACLLLLSVSGYLGWPMYLLSLGAALSLFIASIVSSFARKAPLGEELSAFRKLPYELIPFVLSMFVIVLCLKEVGVADELSKALGSELVTLKYGLTSYLSCNVMNNIPMSLFYSTVPQFADPVLQSKAIYSTIAGSNLGAFLTPIGALAGIMFTKLLRKYDVEYPVWKFVVYGALISMPSLLSCLGMIEVILR